jgi:phosphoenolpyruvate carboxykinase (ATP)
VLDPVSAWPNQREYEARYKLLGACFSENFMKYADDCPPEVIAAGPQK